MLGFVNTCLYEHRPANKNLVFTVVERHRQHAAGEGVPWTENWDVPSLYGSTQTLRLIRLGHCRFGRRQPGEPERVEGAKEDSFAAFSRQSPDAYRERVGSPEESGSTSGTSRMVYERCV